MKGEVVYYSKTGNTKKVADVIAETIGTRAKSSEEKIDMSGCDLICVGSGAYYGKPGVKISNFLKNMEGVGGKKGAVFGTCGFRTDFLDEMEGILKEKGVDVIDRWSCKGRLFGIFNRGRPNEEDLKDAREFAERLKVKLG